VLEIQDIDSLDKNQLVRSRFVDDEVGFIQYVFFFVCVCDMQIEYTVNTRIQTVSLSLTSTGTVLQLTLFLP
jgi:hypothetical protein